MTPWHTEPLSETIEIYDEDGCYIAATGNSEDRANHAQLIASAPDLLDALIAINRILTVPAAEYVPAITDAWKVIDAAVAKATGKGTPP